MQSRDRSLVRLIVRVLVGAVLLTAGVAKILDPGAWSAGASWALMMIPVPLRMVVMWAVPPVEFVTGAFLLPGLYCRAASLIVMVMTAAFTAALAAALLTGVPPRSCGCFAGTLLD